MFAFGAAQTCGPVFRAVMMKKASEATIASLLPPSVTLGQEVVPMAQITKKALAASLKKLLREKPLDKVTIIDIVEDCEVNRQTFYYHFQDIYDLIDWIFLTEALVTIDDKKTYATWQQGFLEIFQYVLANHAFVSNMYHSVSRDQLERYLYSVTYELLIGVVEEQAAGMGVRDEDKKFIADFYKFAFVGLMLDWIRQGMKEDPVKIINRLGVLVQGDIARALEKYSMDYKSACSKDDFLNNL